MLLHQIEQRGQLGLGQRSITNVDNNLRPMKKVRPLAKLPTERTYYFVPGC
jgi:hypothetical protein